MGETKGQVIWIKTPWRLDQNTKAFLKNLKFFFKNLLMFSFGLLARRGSVLLEDQRVSCQKPNALPAIYVQYSFHVQNFRNFKLLDIERVFYEVPLWTSFLFVIVNLHVFSRPDCTLWYYRLSGDGTSSGNFMLISLIYNKFEVPEEDFRVLFFPIIYNNKV